MYLVVLILLSVSIKKHIPCDSRAAYTSYLVLAELDRSITIRWSKCTVHHTYNVISRLYVQNNYTLMPRPHGIITL